MDKLSDEQLNQFKDLLLVGKFFSTTNSKKFSYLVQDFHYLREHNYIDWEAFYSGINNLKLEYEKKEINKFLKYLNLINDFFHLYETFYSVLLKGQLNGKETNNDKLSLFSTQFLVETDEPLYFYLTFLNKTCSAFRNKISHGSILSVAIKFALSSADSHTDNFDVFMESASNLDFSDDNLSAVQSDKSSFLEQRFHGNRHIVFDSDLNKTSMNIKVKFNDLIKQIENKICKNIARIQRIEVTILRMNGRCKIKEHEFMQSIIKLKNDNIELNKTINKFNNFHLNIKNLFNLLFECIDILQKKID